MRKLLLYGVIGFQVLLIVSLIRGVQLSLRSRGRIADLQTKKAQLQVEAEKIKQQETYVQSPYYLEKVAREELHLSKPGEKVVIVPESITLSVGETKEDRPESREKPNYLKWWEVLRGGGW